MHDKKTIVIIGATSAMARHCARLWAQDKSVDLTLVGRDRGRLERVGSDLRVRSPSSDVQLVETEFLDPAAIQQTVDRIVARSAPDIVLIAHGFLPEQRECQDHLQACRDALEVNGISPVLYAEAFANHMERAGHGTLALIGSVAGDRGRRSNYVYGSAKGLVTRYAQGLQHRFSGTAVRVVLIKPGPTDTPMTARLKQGGATLATVEEVARGIVAAVNSGSATAYVPAKWQLIMMVIRHLPRFIFARLNI